MIGVYRASGLIHNYLVGPVDVLYVSPMKIAYTDSANPNVNYRVLLAPSRLAAVGHSLRRGFCRTAIVPRTPCMDVAQLPLTILLPAWARFYTPPIPTDTRIVPPV